MICNCRYVTFPSPFQGEIQYPVTGSQNGQFKKRILQTETYTDASIYCRDEDPTFFSTDPEPT